MRLKFILNLWMFLFLSTNLFSQKTAVKVACIGNSITYGAFIANRDQNSYPAQLQAYLGDGYEVRNYGVSGRTLLTQGDYPYVKTKEYIESQNFQPDIVLIKLGTNDTKPQNWKYKDEFMADYQHLIDSYKALNSHPRIILLTPIRCFLPEGSSINAALIKQMCHRKYTVLAHMLSLGNQFMILTVDIIPNVRLSFKLHTISPLWFISKSCGLFASLAS